MSTLNYKHDSSLFSNAFGFLRLPLEFDPYNIYSDWVITGIPFDLATSGRSGSRFGPAAIRQASINLSWESKRWPWNFDIRKKLKIIDCGDLIYKTGDMQDFTKQLENHVENLLISGKKMLALGGDHYITLPILRAYSKFFSKIAIIHFDAHTDCYDNGQYDHGSFMLQILNEKLIDFDHSVQIGIRTEYNKDLKITVLDAEYINTTSLSIVLDKVISIIQSVPVYISFDVDCLDPSVAPGTGTPVIGGLMACRVLRLIRGFQKLNIVGIDMVEVAPMYDLAGITALAAATLSLEMLYIQIKT